MLAVSYTEDARADLRDLGDRITQDNPSRAATFVSELLTYAATIAELPFLYPPLPRYEQYGIRKRNFRGYLIFYRVTDRVEIVRVISDRRDYLRLLFPD